MPRRSARIKSKNEEQKDVEMEIECESTMKKGELTKATEIEKQSVSNNNMSDDDEANIEMEQKEESQSLSIEQSLEVTTNVKRLSIDTNTILPPPLNKADDDDDDDVEMTEIKEEEDEYIDAEPGATLAQTRSRRNNNKPKISYKDESSSSEDEDEDADNSLFDGLSKKERKALRLKMEEMQSSYSESVRKERELKLEEIICSFEFNIGEKVSKDEAGFIYDFCRKHQYDVTEKIEEEGDFFLISMREMIEEKMKLIQAGIRTKNKNKRNKNGDDSDSEFDLEEYDDDYDDDSDYSMGDSDWDNPLQDNENMISDDDDDDFILGGNRNKKRRRKRNKNVWIDKDGKEYRCAGRLLLDDALKDTKNFEGWSAARVQAWKNKAVNPNAYYYRFNDPGEPQKNGRIGRDEHKVFMQRVIEHGVNIHWGTFSKSIPGRVGYQCSNYWRQMMKDQWVKDPNYWIRSDGSFQFKRAKKGSIPDEIRKYSFVVLQDPSKIFNPLPGYHPKRPSDKKLAKYLEKDVKSLSDKQKKGGKRSKKSDNTNNSNNSNNSNNKEEKSDTDNSDNDNDGNHNKPKRRIIGKKGAKPPKDPNKPKQSPSSFLLFTNAVRGEFKEKNPDKNMPQLSKLMGLKWKEMSDQEKKPYIDKAKILKDEYQKKLIEYQQTENYQNYQKILKEWHEKQMDQDQDDENDKEDDDKENDDKENDVKNKKDEQEKLNQDNENNQDDEGKKSKKKKNKKKKKDKKNKKKKKSKKKKDKKSKKKKSKNKSKTKSKKKDNKNGEEESEKESENEGNETSPTTKSNRGKKRKHPGGEPSELEPPQKKRKLASKSENKNDDKENDDKENDDKKNDDHPLSVLSHITDIMTGDKLSQPAISPYGYVMDYNSWCSILRNPRTKNKCPFTQKPMTRRSLIKLDENNIQQYEDKIVNITAEDIKNFKTSSS